MKRSDNRILTTHSGSLPRPEEVSALVAAKEGGEEVDSSAYGRSIAEATSRVVARQALAGIDIVNDGEVGKSSWQEYVLSRVTGIESRPAKRPGAHRIRRERIEFPGYFNDNPARELVSQQFVCVGPITYVGRSEVAADIEGLKSAAEGKEYAELFMSAMTPAATESMLENEYYSSIEEMWYALAEALREEYEAIVRAGLVLQLDDPALCKIWTAHPEYDLPRYLRVAEQGVEALNYALRNVPREQVRQHVCWGAGRGPHTHDIPLRDIVSLVLKVNCGAYGIEAANPRHEHEWKVWKEVSLPDGAILIPGVVTNKTNIVEHPEVVADRILRYAYVVGRDNVIAGTDCGMANHRIHSELAWAKLRALAEGAALASQQLGAKVD